MVRRRRLTSSRCRGGELVGDDSELPSPIRLTRRQIIPRRIFGAKRRSSGMPVLASSKLAGARVSGYYAESSKKEERRNLGFIPSGGTSFYSHRRSAAFILGVEKAAADRSIPSTPPSCLRARGRRRPEEVSWARTLAGCGCWAAT
jgi:hypothetical protein